MAIKRNQNQAGREAFATDLRNSLPRQALGHQTNWQAGRESIERSIEADRWLNDNGFDRWGRPLRLSLDSQ
jgi:hypothetical protein